MKALRIFAVTVLVFVTCFAFTCFLSSESARAQANDIMHKIGQGYGDPANYAFSCMAYYGDRVYAGTFNSGGGGCEVITFYPYSEVTYYDVGAGYGAIIGPGFGDSNNWYADCMAVYGNALYVGVGNYAAGCEIWRRDAAGWSPVVGGGAPMANGFGDANNLDPWSMAVYGGKLYVGTNNSASGCEVWRYDGSNWSAVVGGGAATGPGFGNPANGNVYSMVACGSHLYAGTSNPGGCQIWRYDGSNWSAVVGGGAPTGPGFGDAGNTTVTSMAVYKSWLFAGTSNAAGCEVWKYDGSSWTQEVGGGPAADPSGPGFGDPNNVDVASMAVYDGHLLAGTNNWAGTGCGVWSSPGAALWEQVVGQGPAIDPTGPGFGNVNNSSVISMALADNLLYLGTVNGAQGADIWMMQFSTTWYLAEGANAGGFETWILVQNPNPDPVDIGMMFQTDRGSEAGPVDTIPANSRRSYRVSPPFESFDISTTVYADANVICERSMYWTPPGSTNRVLGHDSVGVTNPAPVWYLAEGATAGGFETWVLVQNPNPAPVEIDVKFQTAAGEVAGPRETIAAGSRRSYAVDSYVDTFDVSTKVTSLTAGSNIVCERSVYWTPPGSTVRTVGHESVGATSPHDVWYLAEGATAGGFETWVLVQNPNPFPVNIDVVFQAGTGPVQGPQAALAPNSRQSYSVGNYVTTFDVSTQVTATGGGVICERAMYWTPPGSASRALGHDSIGVVNPTNTYYLAEGCTDGGFETWVLVQNPNSGGLLVDITFQTASGEVAGPSEVIPMFSRRSYRVNDYVTSYDVSTLVHAQPDHAWVFPIICERAVYWTPPGGTQKVLGTDSIGFQKGWGRR